MAAKNVEDVETETKLQNSDDSDDSADSCSVVKALRNPVILTGFLRKMKTRDLLKNCRLVSREWRDLSTSILLKRKTFQVEFRENSILATYFNYRLNFVLITNSNSYSSLRELDRFTEVFPTFTTFPCAHFILDGNLKLEDAQEFLDQFGSRVKGLKLTEDQHLSCLRKLFLEQIPHVESLELSAKEKSDSDSRIFSQDSQSQAPAPQLSSLTFLKLGKGNSAELIKEILDAAPNLQECFGIRSREEIEWLRQCHRLDIVKSLKLNPGKYSSQNSIEKLKPMLKILQKIPDQLHLTCFDVNYSNAAFFNDHPEIYLAFCSIVSKILLLSQTTLKQLKFAPDPNLENLIGWSTLELEKVEKLTLKGDLIKMFVDIFPPAEVPQIFPNLHTIHLKNTNFERIPLEEITLFADHPPISSVKSLIISGTSEQITIRIFLGLFPKITHLALGRMHSFSWIAPIIWKEMKGLKSLQVNLRNCDSSDIDAAFTGIDDKMCQRIRNSRSGKYSEWEIDMWRKLSIVNLTELEELFLPAGFSDDEYRYWRGGDDDDDEDQLERFESNIATFVSFEYAFKLMPKLRIYPHADH